MAAIEKNRAAPVGWSTETIAAISRAAGRPAPMNTETTGPDPSEAPPLYIENDPGQANFVQTTNATTRERTSRIRGA